MAVDVLGDMITNSVISEDDVEAERDVILDEIAMHDDDPDDVVHNLFASQAWGDSPLGRPIAGTVESIGALSRDQITRFYRSHYRPADHGGRGGRQHRPRRRRTPGAHRVRTATASSPAPTRPAVPWSPSGSAGSTPVRRTPRARSSRSTSSSA